MNYLRSIVEKQKNKDNFYEFKGYIFKIEAETNMSIDYVITEVV